MDYGNKGSMAVYLSKYHFNPDYSGDRPPFAGAHLARIIHEASTAAADPG
jgi:hypothetical protein